MSKFKMPSGKSQPEPKKRPKDNRTNRDYMQPNISMKDPIDCFKGVKIKVK